MMRAEFQAWLKTGQYSPKYVSDLLAECGRVDTHHGDLDAHYNRDRMGSLLKSLTPRHYVGLSGD